MDAGFDWRSETLFERGDHDDYGFFGGFKKLSMARRGSSLVSIEQVARAYARQQRITRTAQSRLEREAKQHALASHVREVDGLNAALREEMESLRGILAATLDVNDTIAFDSLRLHTGPFKPPASLTTPTAMPRREDFVNKVRPVGFLERLLSGEGRYERELQSAELQFAAQQREYEETERERLLMLNKFQARHEAHVAEVRRRNEEVDLLQAAYAEGEPSAIVTYCSMVLERSQYPSGLPQAFRLAYIADSNELVIDYEMPAPGIVPSVAEYRYVKTKNLIEEKPRKASEIRDTYQDVVAAVTLRTIHEVFEADKGRHLAVIVFNGFVNAVDPATGRDIRPYLISVRVTRERFSEIDLGRVCHGRCENP